MVEGEGRKVPAIGGQEFFFNNPLSKSNDSSELTLICLSPLFNIEMYHSCCTVGVPVSVDLLTWLVEHCSIHSSMYSGLFYGG